MANLNKANLQTDIDSKVYENTSNAITGTNLNTVLTDINDSKASLKDNNTFEGTISATNLSGTNTGDETTTTLGSKINGATDKATPIDADLLGLVDSAASNILKKLSWANVKATLKTYFDTLYNSSLGYTPENVSNKSTSTSLGTSDTLYPTQNAVKVYADARETAANSYADGLVVGLWDDRGSFDASGGSYPSTGGSGTSGAIKKGDIWTVSVAGTLPTGQVVEVGDVVRALVDTPGQTQANWSITQNNIGYTAENAANKSTDVNTDQASNTKYPSVKSVYDYTNATFRKPLSIRHDLDSGYDYIGYALSGTSESSTGWTITRLTINSLGVVTATMTPNVASSSVTWSNRKNGTYTYVNK
jgi:hypothetical protein